MNIKSKNSFCQLSKKYIYIYSATIFFIKKKRKKKFYTYFMLSFGFSLVDFTLI